MAFDQNDQNESKNETQQQNNYYQPYGSKAPHDGNYGYNGFPDGNKPADPDGTASKTIGIIGLIVSFCFCQIAGLIMGIIGYRKANLSVAKLGFETSDASAGRVLGIINIVLSILLLIGVVISAFFSATLWALIENMVETAE